MVKGGEYIERTPREGLHVAAFTLVMVGALNWGLVGLLNLNVVSAVLGADSALEKLVYVLVGLSAVWLAWKHKDDCKTCAK